MNDNYTYPAIIEENESGQVDIIFPDFENAVTCATDKRHFVEEAQDFLVLLIDDYEETGQELPEANSAAYTVSSGQQLVFINVWMPYHRSQIKVTYTKKTLTIPLWLDILAKKNDINFSATLVEALKDKLGLQKN